MDFEFSILMEIWNLQYPLDRSPLRMTVKQALPGVLIPTRSHNIVSTSVARAGRATGPSRRENKSGTLTFNGPAHNNESSFKGRLFLKGKASTGLYNGYYAKSPRSWNQQKRTINAKYWKATGLETTEESLSQLDADNEAELVDPISPPCHSQTLHFTLQWIRLWLWAIHSFPQPTLFHYHGMQVKN